MHIVMKFLENIIYSSGTTEQAYYRKISSVLSEKHASLVDEATLELRNERAI